MTNLQHHLKIQAIHPSFRLSILRGTINNIERLLTHMSNGMNGMAGWLVVEMFRLYVCELFLSEYFYLL